MRCAPSFHSRIVPSRLLPMIEYSVEASRTLVMKSSAPAASPRIVESNGFADIVPLQVTNAVATHGAQVGSARSAHCGDKTAANVLQGRGRGACCSEAGGADNSRLRRFA